ncbi:tryptophan halogenase family protein [Polaromonas sp. AET17H-212]|uniref:tryptophan halogenase family protein n=1 Tax=Polaromonas sp. AET17H-212 TaxID=1977061 RepID=UPI000BBC2A1A|nr:tryptophan halogenase family protein [Polaromonas sp. AET17H-212]
MLNLLGAKRIVVVGGGTAGWLSALEMRHSFPLSVEVLLIESAQLGILGAGEGSIPNLDLALKRYQIDRTTFMSATQSTYKLGVCFEGWRSGGEEKYHHMFSTIREDLGLMEWQEHGFYPLSSTLLNRGMALDRFPDAAHLMQRKASQAEVAAHIQRSDKEVFAYHFDARRLATFLREKAESRGIKRVDALVQAVTVDPQGKVTTVNTDKGNFDGDFFIDASGFSRLILGKGLGIEWESFQKYLLLDAALPFLLPQKDKNPSLITHSKAMNSGWMWTIPTQGRLGCGYVYSSAHISETEVLRELELHWKQEIVPVNRLRFSPGRLKKCLHSNVMAVGLASGFVEPLEATSIAQTLYQLAFFGNLMRENQRVIPERVLNIFNADVANFWDGIVDFLVMHYDTSRADTPFWMDVGKAARPDRYLELKEAFSARTPRIADLVPYQMGGVILFGVASWETVGSAMGIVSPESTVAQLALLEQSAHITLENFIERYQRSVSSNTTML